MQVTYGIFEGNNYTVRGVYVNRTADYNGIFGNSNMIQNLTIKDSYVVGTTATGGIVGNAGTVKNCHNINTTVMLVKGNYQCVGGIVGQVRNNQSMH